MTDSGLANTMALPRLLLAFYPVLLAHVKFNASCPQQRDDNSKSVMDMQRQISSLPPCSAEASCAIARRSALLRGQLAGYQSPA